MLLRTADRSKSNRKERGLLLLNRRSRPGQVVPDGGKDAGGGPPSDKTKTLYVYDIIIFIYALDFDGSFL